MINCLIVDDEQHCIDVLKHYLSQSSNLNLVGTATTTAEALAIFNEEKVDLLFQDIHMPEMTGIEFVRLLDKKCEVIFTTAYAQHAVEGFELGVIDYLLKPISLARFLKAVQKVTERRKPALPEMGSNGFTREGEFFYIKSGVKGSVVRINTEEIEYIECLKNYAAIYHRGSKTLAYMSLRELETFLPPASFARVHKSFIVPVARILRIEGGEILLVDGKTRINIGEAYRIPFWNKIRDKTIGA